jgi:predicted hydrocarbon binding protein
MIGDICKHLEEFSIQKIGTSGWNDICKELSIQRADSFKSTDEAYLDKDFNLIIEALAKKMSLDVKNIWRQFGKTSTLQFIQKSPHFLKRYTTPRELLVALNDMHYVQVKEKYENANLPYFYHKTIEQESLVTKYYSRRKLCFYFEGGLETLAIFYKSPVSYKQNCCQHDGSSHCEFEIKFI